MSDAALAWLRAQLENEAEIATKAKAMRYDLPTDAPWERERIIADGIGGNSRAIAVHRIVAVFANPDRVLAEIKAKRELLDCLVGATGKGSSRLIANDEPWAIGSDELVKMLARPYADRDGFPQEWR